jgi:PKD repeat protein
VHSPTRLPARIRKPVHRHNIERIIFIIALLISGAVCCPVFADVDSNETALYDTHRESLQGEYRHPLMQFTPQQLNEIREHYETAPLYNASIKLQDLDGDTPAGSKNLLPYLTYTPSERNQGMCGNCWVWASTGALEIENNVKSGIQDRLSVQYFNSRYNGGAGSNWACCGGWLGQFTSFHTGDKTTVPWSNTNAGWGDYYSSCGQYITAVPAGSIAAEPSYTILSISDSSIETRGVGQDTAVDNIKSALNENKPVWYAFYYGNNGWNAFENAWWTQSETSVFNPVPYAGEENAGGHAVLIVGYDDTDPANPYWIVLNSWGTTGSRPQGLFRVNMSLDYDSVIYSSGSPFPQHMFSILEADVVQTPPPAVNFTADPTMGSAPLSVQFTDQSTIVDPLEWDWDFGDGSDSASRNPQHEYATRGIYTVSLEVTNSTGVYSRTRSNYITVTLPEPVPEFAANPASGPYPLTVSFTDYSHTDPTVWAWFFGDEDYSAPWSQVNAEASWMKRYGQTSVVMPDGSIIMMGGSDGTARFNDVWRSADKGMTWTEMTSHAGWSARYFHTSVATADGSIVVMGGHDGSNIFRNDVWRSTDNGVTWTEETANAPWAGRAVHSSVALPDGSIVLFGGNNGMSGRLNDVWRSTDYGATWTAMTTSAEWIPRWSQSASVLPDGSIVMTGGWNSEYLYDVWRSTDYGATWTRVNNTLGGISRGFHSTVSLPDNSILMMGGANEGGGRNDVWRSADSGATWTLLTDNAAWSDRYYQNVLALPDAGVILIGGLSGTATSDVWQFQPAGSQEQNPVHTYTIPGTYTVALQVMNATGINSTRKSGYITVDNSPDQEITISPGAPHIINNTIAYSGDGTTIILNPGIYYEHDIVIGHNVTIRANTSFGGNAANTIIDGQSAGRIIDDSVLNSLTYTGYSLTIDNLTLRNGYAAGSGQSGYGGGIIVSWDGVGASITSSSFENCSAAQGGGAIAAYSEQPCCNHPVATVISSSFTNCSASQGNILYATQSSTAAIHYSRIYNNSGTAVYSDYGSIDATNNWWGSNDNPSSQVHDASYNPWLVLNVIATPSSVTTSGTSKIEANFTFNSDEEYLDPDLGHIPDGLPVTYATTTGSTLPLTGTMTGGLNTTVFSPSEDGLVLVNATVDGQTVTTGEEITAPRIQSIYPATGTSAGGTSVTITGIRFFSVTGVSFGTTAAASYTVDSDTQISAVSPAHTVDIVNVTITTDHGPNIPSPTNRFTYTPATPVFAIDPGTSIQTAIECSDPGYTIILNPGTYREHDISVTKDIMIRANTSAGGNAANTIIDGENAGRIFDVRHTYHLTVDNLTFINGSATDYGGAIFVTDWGTATITSSSFSRCSAALGGDAVAAVGPGPCCSNPRVIIHYSRIYQNSGTDMVGNGGTVDATSNWWGSNSDPSGHVSGEVTTSPWLVLSITATPSTMTTGETSLIRVNLTRNSAGTDTISGGIFFPDGIPVAFARTSGTGSLAPQAGNLSRGSNSTTFMPAGAGTGTITATVDGETVSTDITVTGTSSRVGIFRNGLWDLDYNGNFVWDGSDKSFTIGQASDIPVTGDWNRDGKDEIGIFRNGVWALDFNGNRAWDAGDKAFVIGKPGDVPVVGDWNGNGNDSVGIFRNGLWGLDYNDNYAWDASDKAFNLGTTGDIPVVGDWDASGSDSAGIFRNGLWGLDYNGNFAWDGADKAFNLGTTGDKPVVGDWDATGSDSAGIFRNGLWGVDYNGNFAWDGADKAFNLGTTGDKPVVGDWDNTGSDSAGIFRNGIWGLDYNGNFAWDASDKAFNLGQNGDVPVMGRWS